MEKGTSVWCIFYINNKEWKTINDELASKGYEGVRALVPTISILKKRQKGKDIYEEVPVLFSYGFIRMPKEKAFSRPFLNKLKRDIAGIQLWVKDTNSMHPKKLKKRVDNSEDFDDFSLVATATRKEIRRFQRIAKENRVYSGDEITSLKVGTYVILRGYPFDGVDATIEDINLTTNQITVLLYPTNGSMKVNIPMENVVYSIYHNYHEDKLYANQGEFDPGQILSSSIDNLISSKQY